MHSKTFCLYYKMYSASFIRYNPYVNVLDSLTGNLQSNMIPERATIFDFCFEKKASGSWCDWMDTIDKSTLAIPASAKVGKH